MSWRWRGHLENLLGNPHEIEPVQNRPALPWQALPDFMEHLIEREGDWRAGHSIRDSHCVQVGRGAGRHLVRDSPAWEAVGYPRCAHEGG